MKKRVLCLLPLIATLILEILPYGAVCNFANPEGDPWRKTYSYFDLTPFGYANFAPLITAIITCILFILLILYCFTGKRRLAVVTRNILGVCIVFSLGPLLYGIHFFSAVGILITISLFVELVFLQSAIKE